jgi:predicted nucleic acid-binding protein
LRIVSNTSPIVALDHLGELDLIPSIRPKLEALRSLPFHISPRLQEDVLTQARE